MLDTGLLFLLLVLGVLGQACPMGKYGEHCELNCSRYCYPHSGQDVHCDRHSGTCSEGCIPGWYGGQCLLPCSKNCRKNTCSHQTGHCTLGCKGNNTGDFCETPQESGSKQSEKQSQDTASTPLVAILVPVFAIIIIIIIIIIITVTVYKQRQKRHRKSNQPPDDNELTATLEPGEVDTPLIVACQEGKLDAVRAILAQSLEDINTKGKKGMTPVMWATRRGHRELVDLLVRKEADVTLVDGNGHNILHWACYGGHVAMVKHVVSKNMVDINSSGRDGRTPLMFAARQGRKKMFDLLVSKGGIPSQVDKKGNNILLLACWGGNVEIVKYILSHKTADINGRGQSRWTPLMGAAYNGHAKVFDLLVEEGADLTLTDEAGDNVLHAACLGGHVDIVSSILKLDKVYTNSQGQCRRTPLMMAAGQGEKEIFDLLFVQGVDASLVDDDKNSILHLACKGGHLGIVRNVLSLDIGDINARNSYNETATMLATSGGEVCNLLVSRGGSIQ